MLLLSEDFRFQYSAYAKHRPEFVADFYRKLLILAAFDRNVANSIRQSTYSHAVGRLHVW